MILCVTPNPSVDRTLVVPGFRLGQIHRPQEVLALPGGKGINVARTLKTLGEEPLVTGWVGGAGGSFIEKGLEAEEIAFSFLRTSQETRACTSIFDPQTGSLTEIYENGALLESPYMTEFSPFLAVLLKKCSAAVFSGSLPPGLSPQIYAGWITDARRGGLLCALDASGDALKIGLEQGRPHLIKPNRSEFCRLTGMAEASTIAALASTAREVARQFEVIVLLSLGEDGALAADGVQVWQAAPPPVLAVSPVGSGDAFLAGAVSARLSGAVLEEVLRCGVAAGTANTLRLGAGRLLRADYLENLEKIQSCRVI